MLGMPTSLPPQAPSAHGDSSESGGVNRTPEPARAPTIAQQHPLIAAESDPANAITVGDSLRITHPLLVSTREAWKIRESSSFQWGASLPKDIHLPLRRALRPRALRILQALFSALDKRGFKLALGEQNHLQVTVLEETCEVRMRERQRQVRAERRRLSDRSLFPGKKPHDLIDTGELVFTVARHGHPTPAVGDRKGSRLEEQLNAMVVCLLEAALEAKAWRANQEERRLAALERDRLQARAEQRARERLERITRLEHLADAARRHKELLAFRDDLRDATGAVDANSELGRWLSWIDEHLDRSDVLTRFRDQRATLTLYHCLSTYSRDWVLAHGFENMDPDADEEEESSKTVDLTDVPMEGTHGGTVCIVIDVPQDAVLPYETLSQEREYRQFLVPAKIANRFARRVHSE